MRRPFHVAAPLPLTAVAAALLCCGPAAFGQVAPLRLETELREQNLSSGAPRPTFARGDAIDGRQDRETTLQGRAEIRRGSTVVRADRITLYEADDEVVTVGNVRIVHDGQVFTGPE
ncbi:MAG: hypothetical protein ACOYLX_02760, partial [Burkholderiaceae bacterium]